MKYSFLFLVFLLLVPAAAGAQQTLTPKRITAPIQYVGTYHMASQSWTGGARVGTDVIYNCTTPGNYYASVGNSNATNSGHLWIDEGELADSNGSQVTQITGFDFSYCSTDLDPTGNDGSILIAFYDDHGSCAVDECPRCCYLISGLPLSTTGNTQCWSVAVDLSGGFECSTNLNGLFRTSGNFTKLDTHFGWAFGSNPGVAGRNNTGPIQDLPCADPLSNCSLGGGLSAALLDSPGDP